MKSIRSFYSRVHHHQKHQQHIKGRYHYLQVLQRRNLNLVDQLDIPKVKELQIDHHSIGLLAEKKLSKTTSKRKQQTFLESMRRTKMNNKYDGSTEEREWHAGNIRLQISISQILFLLTISF